MVEQSEYWKRVEEAVRVSILLHHLPVEKVALAWVVLPSDLRKRILEMKKEQDDRGE